MKLSEFKNYANLMESRAKKTAIVTISIEFKGKDVDSFSLDSFIENLAKKYGGEFDSSGSFLGLKGVVIRDLDYIFEYSSKAEIFKKAVSKFSKEKGVKSMEVSMYYPDDEDEDLDA